MVMPAASASQIVATSSTRAARASSSGRDKMSRTASLSNPESAAPGCTFGSPSDPGHRALPGKSSTLGHRRRFVKIAILVGSTRPGRKGAAVGQWVHEATRERDAAEFELVEVADHDLPLLDEPVDA